MRRLCLAAVFSLVAASAHADVYSDLRYKVLKIGCEIFGPAIAFEATRNLPAWNLRDGDGSWNLASGYWVTRFGDVQDIATWGDNPPRYTEYVRGVVGPAWREVCYSVAHGIALPPAPKLPK